MSIIAGLILAAAASAAKLNNSQQAALASAKDLRASNQDLAKKLGQALNDGDARWWAEELKPQLEKSGATWSDAQGSNDQDKNFYSSCREVTQAMLDTGRFIFEEPFPHKVREARKAFSKAKADCDFEIAHPANDEALTKHWGITPAPRAD